MDRRRFLQAGVFTAGGTASLPLLAQAAGAQTAGTSPYGSIEGREPDENGLLLPEGFTSRIVAVSGDAVGSSSYEWHLFPDGAATFDDGEGGWYHTVNSEVFNEGLGGAGAIHYDADGNIIDAYPVLTGSTANCGGGPTPWGTFLSGEEIFGSGGVIWEIDPTGQTDAVARPAMGIFPHEAAAVDPVREHVYLTEDMPDGRLYRFTPDSYPDLSSGLLEVMLVSADNAVSWVAVPDPTAAETPTRLQVEESWVSSGGEGIWYHEDWIFWSTKFTHTIHGVNIADATYTTLYAANAEDREAGTAVLTGVDNLTVDEGSGDIFVAEDGGNMEVVIITPDGEVAPFLRITGQDNSEVTGPVFNPRRDRLYFSSQRGPTNKTLGEINPGIVSDDRFGGITYEVTGPFRGIEAPVVEEPEVPVGEEPAEVVETTTTTTVPAPTTTLAAVSDTSDNDDDGGGSTGVIIGAGAVAVIVAGAGVIGLRRRGGS
jgi:secreted PhoX family phosphatase